MFPTLFLTDITNVPAADLGLPANHSGDWQYGGVAITPSAVFGTWKAFTETINLTTGTVTLTADAVDPVQNNWNLGTGADTPPPGLLNEGYGAEVRWSVDDLAARGYLVAGHTYRFYVMDHDGDQNNVGGDSGQACFDYFYAGPVKNPSTLSGAVYNDANNNGLKDSAEAGVPDVAVKLLNTNGTLVTTVYTDSTGAYQFKNLAGGTNYQILETQPSVYLDGKDTQGTITAGGSNLSVTNDRFTISIPAAGSASGTGYNFGEISPASTATKTASKAFTSTPIAAGNTLWFSSEVKMSGLTTTGQGDVTLRMVNSSIKITPTSGAAYTIPVPNAMIVFNNATTNALSTTTFDTANNMWVTTVGKFNSVNDFLSALPWKAPVGNLARAGFSWTGTFLVDTAGVDVTASFTAAAAVYNTTSPSFTLPTDLNNFKVKPIDASGASPLFNNTDKAGTPEGSVVIGISTVKIKSKVISGALGTGGTAYTGAYTTAQDPTAKLVPLINPLNATESFQTTPVTPQLLATGTVALGAAGEPALTDADLAPLVEEATRLWAAAGADTSKLNGVRFAVTDLPADTQGTTTNGFIQIDLNAAGMGWFIDSTPGTDNEFSLKGAYGSSMAIAGDPAFGHVDLLTVIEHEIGNVLGYKELNGGTQQIMEVDLSTGLRRAVQSGPAGGLAGPAGSTFANDVSINNDWNYYVGTDPNSLGADQIDFQSVFAHKSGRVLGLGHSSDLASAMSPYLAHRRQSDARIAGMTRDSEVRTPHTSDDADKRRVKGFQDLAAMGVFSEWNLDTDARSSNPGTGVRSMRK
jgi:hypothetical protein